MQTGLTYKAVDDHLVPLKYYYDEEKGRNVIQHWYGTAISYWRQETLREFLGERVEIEMSWYELFYNTKWWHEYCKYPVVKLHWDVQCYLEPNG